MPWLLASPGHQQPWYWWCRIGRSLSYSRRNFNYLCLISVEEWHKMWIYVYVISEKNSTKRVNIEAPASRSFTLKVPCDFMRCRWSNKQRVLMHGHQGWNVRHGLCHIYMIYVYIWVVHSFCLFCCLFIIVTTQFVTLYEPCKPKPKPKPSTYDTRTTTPWQRSKFRYLDRSQSNKYAINMQIQTISVSK